MRSDEKLRKWMFWLLAIAIASQFYVVQELLAAFAFFAFGFGALAFVVVSLYFLQKGWELAVVRILDRAPAATPCLTGQDMARSKSALELKKENRNLKDWNDEGTLNWVGREKRAKEFEGIKQRVWTF